MNTRIKLIAGLILAAAFAAPFAASALSIDELQAQLKDLLSKVAALQAQLKARASTTTVRNTNDGADIRLTAVPRICMLDFAGTIGRGSQGEGVRGLQQFLAGEGVFSASATGYFGTQTEAALKTWQSRQGIVSAGDARTTGWGQLGPATRAKINARCGYYNVITVDPGAGATPLTVTVAALVGDSGSIRPSAYDGQDTLIDFGDGTERQWVNCSGTYDDRYFGTLCDKQIKYTHTYSANGTYTVNLVKAGGMCPGGCAERIIGTASVTVGNEPVACTMEYKPVCAEKQVQCITAPCNPVRETYGNACVARAAGATIVHEGACSPVPDTDPEHDPTCKAWYDGCNSCARETPGGPAMCTLRACTPESMTKPYCTAHFETSSNKPPVISGFSGPSSLAVNETGMWSVSASDPENGKLSYAVVWGDEWYASNVAYDLQRRSGTVVQKSTLTHSYDRPGIYTVGMTVKDESGATARSTMSVNVTQTVCTADYAPVCGRPSGCANTCAPGMVCPAICQLYQSQTYSNRCQLNNANATLIHEGACTGTETY